MKKALLIFILSFFTTTLISQHLQPVSSIKALIDSIEVIRTQENITGLMVGITTRDSIIFSGGFGYADLQAQRNVDENTLFRMGSITKMFVSLGIMKLISEGKLKLDDELKIIAPEVPFQNEWETTNPVRIVHLLEHTSGFDDIKLNRLYSPEPKENTGINMMLVQKNSMICRWKPGERFAYSNPNYSILGYLLEKFTGKAYHQYLIDNILNPIGMVHSNFNISSRFPEKEVKEYIVKKGKTIPVKSVALISGSQGALWSSAVDMVKFLQLFLRKGSPLFRDNIIDEIETCHSSLAVRSGQKNGYSLGNDNTFYTWTKFPFRGHDGLTGTCFSSCKYNRELGVGFVIASNSNNNNSRIGDVIVSYLEQKVPAKKLATQPIDKAGIKDFIGRYQFESPRFEISAFMDKFQFAPKIYFKEDKLFFKPLIGDADELVQTSPGIFAWKGSNMPLICFTKNDNGKNVMMLGGIYYEQTSNFWAMFKRAIVLVCLVFAFSTFISGMVSLIGAITGKVGIGDLVIRLIPMIGVGGLIWAVLNLLEVQQFSYQLSELGNLNFRTVVIFGGTLIFGISAIISLLLSMYKFKKIRNRWYANYFLFTSICLCLIMVILMQNGWIGMRTWAM